MAHSETPVSSSLRVIQEQLEEAIAAPKCHKCGCLQQTVVALSETAAGKTELASVLADAKRIFVPKQYDCLGCLVCYPAIAANAFAEAFPEAGSKLDLCPTEEPDEREGWPPLPGDYSVVRYGAPVAVCTLNTASLVQEIASVKPRGLSVVGTMHTENLGIERVIKNCLTNPNIRFVLLCGEDTQQAVGHLPGQSFECLIRNGIDERGRIVGAKGRRPVLKNVTHEEVQAFRQQIELVSLIGERRLDVIAREIEACANRNPGEFPSPFRSTPIQRVVAEHPRSLVLDRAGYFVIYPDLANRRLVVEHYTNQGILNCVLEGTSVAALYGEIIERQLLTRLDHAAYLGRELTRAERCFEDGVPFVQDAAPEELSTAAIDRCRPAEPCGCTSINRNKSMQECQS